jgi:nitric-oxide synthase
MIPDEHLTALCIQPQFSTPDIHVKRSMASLVSGHATLLTEASAYLHLFHEERGLLDTFPQRLVYIQSEVERRSTYRHTYDELTCGARVAWRNSTRCIGRLHWNTLNVRDMRHLSTPEEIFDALVKHITLATNGGKIHSMITIFAPQQPGEPGIRIWNPQLIRYAGYQQADGSVIGDPQNQELTKVLLQAGWKGGKGTPFDLLPIAIQMPYQAPRLFELPPEIVLEVPILHPHYSWFASLNLKWHALPVISNMRLEIGGISYTAAPFNGWYMGTEIGARNLGDEQRYNLLPIIAEKMGLDIHSDRSLWKDKALIELNLAVLDSFARHGIAIVDHHTASRQFVHHEEREHMASRQVYADWGWIVPPLSGSATPVFHRPYEDTILTPNFFYQSAPWRDQLS